MGVAGHEPVAVVDEHDVAEARVDLVDSGDLWLTGNPQDPIPLPPTSVTASLSGGWVGVAWTAPAFTGGTPLTGYSIVDSQGHQVMTARPSWNHVMFHLPAGDCGEETFTVTAASQVGPGYTSDVSNAVTIPCRG